MFNFSPLFGGFAVSSRCLSNRLDHTLGCGFGNSLSQEKEYHSSFLSTINFTSSTFGQVFQRFLSKIVDFQFNYEP